MTERNIMSYDSVGLPVVLKVEALKYDNSVYLACHKLQPIMSWPAKQVMTNLGLART